MITQEHQWPPEYVLVPRVPTEAMLKAAKAALDEWRRGLTSDEKMLRHTIKNKRPLHSATDDEKYAIRWAAMIAAASAAPCGLCALGFEPFRAEKILWHQVNGRDSFRCTAADRAGETP